MKRIVLILAVFAFIVFASNARADKPVGLTCGGPITYIAAMYDWPTHTWHETDVHYCLLGKIYSWEIQYTTDGKHWYDWSSEHFIASGVCQTGCRFHGRDTGASCSQHRGVSYRIRSWWADGKRTSKPRSAAYACTGGVI